MAHAPRRIWDISPPVYEGSPVFPGDAPYQQEWTATLEGNCPVNLSRITLSPHVGAHADAPLHYDPQGKTIGQMDLEPFLGPCRVVHCIGVRPLVLWEHIRNAIENSTNPVPPRVLVRTYTHMPVNRWDPDLAAFAPDTVQRLADLGVRLIGIDTASIDPADSKTLDSHQVIRRSGLRVLKTWCLTTCPRVTTS